MNASEPISKTLVFFENKGSTGTDILIVDEKKRTVTFLSKRDSDMMKTTGIPIPAIEQKAYEGQSKVTLDDPKFYDAFTKVYLRDHYTDSTHYKWRKTKPQ